MPLSFNNLKPSVKKLNSAAFTNSIFAIIIKILTVFQGDSVDFPFNCGIVTAIMRKVKEKMGL